MGARKSLDDVMKEKGTCVSKSVCVCECAERYLRVWGCMGVCYQRWKVYGCLNIMGQQNALEWYLLRKNYNLTPFNYKMTSNITKQYVKTVALCIYMAHKESYE